MNDIDARAFARYAWSAHLAGDELNAERCFRIARRAGRSDVEANTLYACWLAKRGRHDRAALVFERLARARPSLELLCHWAEAALAVDDFPTALDAIRRAVARDPDYRTPHGARARVLALRATQRLAAVAS